MEQNTLRKQRELTDRLNRYRNEYYNYNNPSVSDESMTGSLTNFTNWNRRRASRCRTLPLSPWAIPW